MYEKSAAVYDAIYTQVKDYREEAKLVADVIQKYKKSAGNNLLDVACGTALHMTYWKDRYKIEGLDLEPEMLVMAKEKLPDIVFHQADMMSFSLNKQFDIVVCLFSAIGHAKTVENMQQAIDRMAAHLKSGGVLVVQPFFTPDVYKVGSLHANFVDQPDLKIARMNISRKEGNLGIMDMHHMVGTPAGVEEFTERFELGLFTVEDQIDAFKKAGLEVIYDANGLPGGRGLYIGTKPV